MDLTRTIIIGNCGSGKSWLGEQISAQKKIKYIDLDEINWMPGNYNIARSRDTAIALLRTQTECGHWIAEGIYGWLVQEFVQNATALIWMRLTEEECVSNIRQRGLRRGGTEAGLKELLDWTTSYQTRLGSSAYSGHLKIFNAFDGEKICIHNRDEASVFLSRS
ncbi:MAG: adenylate kinase [Pseudomonadota bacterium]